MKLHNKFEVIKNGKVVAVGHNQMFASVLDALESYVGFATYVAICGKNGTTESSRTNDAISNALLVVKAQDQEFQINPLVGTMYAKRKIVVPAANLVGAEISSIGFCKLPDGTTDSGQTPICETCNTSLYNHAVLTGENGKEIKITKDDSELEIYSTVYLEWETNQQIMPLGGNNEFVKFLLGSNIYNGTAPTFDFGVGQDHRPNGTQVTQDYLFQKRYTSAVVPTVTKTADKIEFLFATSYVTMPSVCEVILAANNKVAIRQNREKILTNNLAEESVTSSEHGVATLQKVCGGKITKVINANTNETIMETEEELAALSEEIGPAFVSEPRIYAFGEDKDYNISSTSVFESKCGKMMAFVTQNGVDIYKNDNGIKKLDTSTILDPQTITDIQFFNNYVFVVRNSSPYLEMFEWKNDKLVQMTLRLNEAISTNMQGSSFTNSVGQKISIGKDKSGNITIAIKFDANNVGIFVFTAFGRIYDCTAFCKPQLTSIGVFGALVSTGADEGYVVVSGIDSTTYFNVYKYSVTGGLVVIPSSFLANDWETDVSSYSVGARHIHTTRTSSPYEVIWFFDNNQRRIRINDDAHQSISVGNGGNLLFKRVTTNNYFYPVYIRENGQPLIFATAVNQAYFAGNWQQAFEFGNGAVVLNQNEPYCYYIDFGNGFKTVRGLPESTALKIVYQEGIVSHDKDNCHNLLLSLVLEVDQ